MIAFKPVQLSDKAWVDELLAAEHSGSADYCFANIFLWDHVYHQQLARVEDRLVILPCCGPEPFFCYPVGGGEVEPVIRAMEQYAEQHGFPFVMRGVTNNHRAELEAAFPDRFQFEPQRSYFDYLYSIDTLADLEGKKLSAKRNHINYFTQNYRWKFIPLPDYYCSDCESLLHRWAVGRQDDPDGLSGEQQAIRLALEHVWDLGLEGGLIYAEGRAVAFTIGEPISDLVYNIHFEKADNELRGAYPMINREFVRWVRQKHPNIRYINREDDMGLENLRRAKLSYQPEHLLEKYNVTWKD